jgi:predicted CXXCH cytochrome family protein
VKCCRILVAGAFALCSLATLFADSVLNSRHNLSVGGPGSLKAATESQVCIFCHAPHGGGAEAPLWNRSSPGGPYTTYSSSTAIASPGQPSGASKLCLSCHDGTVALGMVRSRSSEILVTGGPRMPPGPSLIGTDLSDDHPVSFRFDQSLYTQNGQLTDPALLTGAVRLDLDGNLQCTTCHDAHDNRFGKFLVMQNQQAALCTSCHAPSGWTAATHRQSSATWNGSPPDPWPQSDRTTVADNACENCHRPHSAASPQRLPIFAPAESGCEACHNGNVATRNIAAQMSKLSAHPVASTEVHDPTEDLVNPPRHVECVDCHNPHAAGGTAPAIPRSIYGVRGVSAAGLPLAQVDHDYELCFRCHADSLNAPAPLINRQFVQSNTRLELNPASLSYHPVLAPGRNPDVPSLISPLTTASTISCGDCHNNDAGPGAGGSGPKGPHGSIYRPILERRQVLTNGTTESAAVYALCYKCHARTQITDDTSFKEHSKHLSSPVNAACSTCHDPHGVESAPHLINLNRLYVTPSSSGRLEFVDNGRFQGACYLTCHGENHNPYTYP